MTALGTWAIERLADTAFDKATSDGPLAVDVDSHFPHVIVPTGKREELPTQNEIRGGSDINQIASSLGGYAVNPSIRLLSYGLADTPVIINKISAVDVLCEKVDESWAEAVVEGGGNLTDLRVGIGLQNEVKVTGRALPAYTGGSKQWQFPRQVSGAEADAFVVEVEAPPKEVCTFRLSVSYTNSGRNGELLVEDDGRSFRAAGSQLGEETVTYSG